MFTRIGAVWRLWPLHADLEQQSGDLCQVGHKLTDLHRKYDGHPSTACSPTWYALVAQ